MREGFEERFLIAPVATRRMIARTYGEESSSHLGRTFFRGALRADAEVQRVRLVRPAAGTV